MLGEVFGRVVRAVSRRPIAVLSVLGVLALAGAALALRLDPSASTDTLVDRSSDSFQATERFKREFGEEAIVILVKGDLQRTVLTSDLAKLLALEGCLSGNVPPRGLRTLPPQCAELAELKAAKVVYGPATFVNTAAAQIADQFRSRSARATADAEAAARAARQLSARRGDPKSRQEELARAAYELVLNQFTTEALRLGLRYGITNPRPTINDPTFVSQLVFETVRGPNVPKARFAYLFPSPDGALIQVRLRPDLSQAERERAIDLIASATREPRFRLTEGGRYVVSGLPVVVEGLAEAVQRSIFILLIAAVLVMAATLRFVFHSSLRLLPLGLALAAAALTFGAVSLAGASLTMASIAALPVLIGLAVDYAIQFQSRFDELRAVGATPPPTAVAAAAAATAGGPTIAAAGLATAVGFLVLLLSPIPMVRGFGVLLVLGIVLAFACALTAGSAALIRGTDRRRAADDVPPLLPRARSYARSAWERVASSRPGRLAAARGRELRLWLADVSGRALEVAVARPRKVLAVGLAVAALGWVVDTQTEVISDVRELVPQDLQALRDLTTVQATTGVAGELDVTVRARDLSDPSVIAWMTRFQGEALAAHGYTRGATCAQRRDAPELCPALSLPDLFRSGVPADQASIRALLDAVPPYFRQAVISEDRRVANLAFGLRIMPLDRQERVIDDIRERLQGAPPGVEADVVGLPVLAAEANGALASTWRRQLTLLAGLAAVFLVLLAIVRRPAEAAVPLIPIALATGWSALVLFVLQIPLNPMSATLGALVLAISTEFGVLLSSRYRQERRAGMDPDQALEVTYRSTGAAVLASGATAIAGFAALIASDIRMLRDFGAVTVIDLTVSLLGVMVVLPAALVWAEERGPLTLRELDPRAALPALRRSAPRAFRAALGRLRALGSRMPLRRGRPSRAARGLRFRRRRA